MPTFEIVDVEQSGELIFESDEGDRYVSGETADDFGWCYMTESERTRVRGLIAQTANAN